MPVLFAVLLAILIAAPGLLALSPRGYDLMNSAHFVVLLLTIAAQVGLGRRQARRGRRAGRVGALVGMAAGAAGSLGAAVITETTPALSAFVQYAGRNGVPPTAAVTMHQLHLVTSAVLDALLAAGFYGVLGGFAAWWGGRASGRRPGSAAAPKADPST